MDKHPIPQSMLDAVRQFADPQVAHDFFVQIRFPNGVACPRFGCGSGEVAYLEKYFRWYCRDCKKQFSAKVGTIFEDSPIGLDKWLPAIWLVASNRNGISSHELSRALHVTQKTAWFILHRVREAMTDKAFTKLAGPVEADETYVGGKPRRPSIGRSAGKAAERWQDKKTIVLGIVQRGKKTGKVRAFVVPDASGKTVVQKVRENVEPGAVVYTDADGAYGPLSADYVRYVVNHATEYVNGHIHTNHIEAFWSLLKRNLRGTQVHVAPEHLQRYVEELVFRFNRRDEQDGPRFAQAAKAADGKRLTYKSLIGKASG
ncbi:MAG TPA: IS1595 family transposase [Candidatus Eremiobacteraceae bacterium]|nr:IS1595 family transposase [Candidatus Eremiobacteraceae bacterium]